MERMNLLVCDLDGTLLGDEDALDEFSAWYARSSRRFRLAYASGRFVESVRASISNSQLPEPDAIIGGVGTQIYDLCAGRRLAMWPPSMFEWNPYVVRAVCASHRELRPQPEDLQSHYKVSYYGLDLDQSFIDRLRLHLASTGQRVTIVYSSNRDVDILPADANKGTATAYLAYRWRIDTQQIIVAGDSGNDADMFHAGFRGIVVGNALPELRSLTAPHIYHATAGFALGVLEGLEHWLKTPLRLAPTGGQSRVVQGAGRGMRE
jgi:mannosylfructose-6-phosphate phosphatase